jgi:type IV pilus assembly protein PilA
MKKKNGFSLIELLIVVAIILIIAAIAIPNLLKSRMAANESSAVGSVRTLNTAQITYQNSCPATGFSASIGELSSGTTCAGGANIIDNVLGSGTKSGYTFASAGKTGTPTTQYDTNASPLTLNVTGVRYFYSNETGVIRGNTGGAASATSAALQ